MFGGKTTRLLSEADRYRYQNKYVIAFKPKMDNRYSAKEIATHNGFRIQALCIEDANEIFPYLKQVPDIYTSYNDVIIIIPLQGIVARTTSQIFKITGPSCCKG